MTDRWRRWLIVPPLVVLCCRLAAAGDTQPPLRFGVVSFYNPRLMYLKYQPLVDYLSVQTGRRWELVVSASYDPTVVSLCSGTVAAAYLGPFCYVRAHEQCGAEPVVRLQTHGMSTYQAYIMVRQDSPITSLEELRGKRVGFGAPESTSSHLVPRAMLMRAGLSPGKDVICEYLEHHERAARSALLGDVAACAVRDIVGDKFLHRGLRVLARSDPIPNFPVVVAPGAPPEVRGALLRALVTLPHVDPRIAATISSWDEELSAGFAPATDVEYRGIRQLALDVFGPLALTTPEASLACSGERP
jgi:phosphonate transport system substrate-binding protein